VPTLYNALPEEIRAIRGYKRYVSALKRFVYAIKYYSRDEYFNVLVLLLVPFLTQWLILWNLLSCIFCF
jgi:hypothetical protein